MKTQNIYQLHISLLGFTPQIWRRMLISSDTLLSDFHYDLQDLMGWSNSHLHQFIIKRICYTERADDDDLWDDYDQVDYEGMKVEDFLKSVNSRMVYEYDFGDGWKHDILLEKILPPDSKQQLPICLAGEMNCPAEDSGGVHGYAAFLKILEDPADEEYESISEWIGEDFDPTYFSL